jgi:hypothetical protein
MNDIISDLLQVDGAQLRVTYVTRSCEVSATTLAAEYHNVTPPLPVYLPSSLTRYSPRVRGSTGLWPPPDLAPQTLTFLPPPDLGLRFFTTLAAVRLGYV